MTESDGPRYPAQLCATRAPTVTPRAPKSGQNTAWHPPRLHCHNFFKKSVWHTLCENREKRHCKVPGMYQADLLRPASAPTAPRAHGPAKHQLAGKSAAQNRTFSNDAQFSVESQRFPGSHGRGARGKWRRGHENSAPRSPAVSAHKAQATRAAGPQRATRRN